MNLERHIRPHAIANLATRAHGYQTILFHASTLAFVVVILLIFLPKKAEQPISEGRHQIPLA